MREVVPGQIRKWWSGPTFLVVAVVTHPLFDGEHDVIYLEDGQMLRDTLAWTEENSEVVSDV